MVNPSRLQRTLGRATLVAVAIGGIYLWNRYEWMKLPGEGCSPLTRISPGNTLWVDRWPGRIEVGDVLFFDVGDGGIAIAEVSEVAPDGDRYWVLTDVEDCPGVDSDELGWISRDAVQGRLMMATNF